jgi:hypothetical protein
MLQEGATGIEEEKEDIKGGNKTANPPRKSLSNSIGPFMSYAL